MSLPTLPAVAGATAFAAFAAFAALAAFAAPAVAGAIHSTDGTPAFSASSAATHTFTVRGGGVTVRSTSSTYNGQTAVPESPSATLNPVWSGTTWSFGGILFPAVVTTSGPWTVTSTNATSPFTASVTTSSTTTITASGLTGSLVLTAQTKPGLTGTNSGANFVLGAAISGMTWAASGNVGTFLGASSGTDGSYSSGGQTINVRGVNVVP